MADEEQRREVVSPSGTDVEGGEKAKLKGKGKSGGKPFSLKKWNAVAMWRWDVDCDTCAICRVQVQGWSCHAL